MMVTLTPSPRTLPRLSLRLKVTLYMSAVALIIQLILGVIVLYVQYTSIDQLFSARLVARADYLAAQLKALGSAPSDENLARLVHTTPQPGAFNQVIATVYTPDSQVLASSSHPAPDGALLRAGLSTPDAAARRRVRGLFEGPESTVRSRIAAVPVATVGGRPGTLLLVAEDWGFEAATGSLLRVFVIASAVGVVAWSFAAWLIAGLAMAPLRDLRMVAGSFSPEAIERDMEFGLSSSAEIAALENDLRESRSKLRSALHAQDRFISNVSHELNTPIAVLLTEAQTLRSHELPPEARAFAQSVTEEMQRLGRMVGSFLTLTKLRGGQGLTVVSPCSINDVVMDTIQQCGHIASQQSIQIIPRLSDESDPQIVCGDNQLLRAMLENLLRNAIRYSPRGSQVQVHVTPGAGRCEIVIRDSGPGVPDNLLNSLFDRFANGPPIQSRRGQGLSLSVAQGIAELHGGQITVRNLAEGGCEFTVRLPVAPDPVPAHADPCPA